MGLLNDVRFYLMVALAALFLIVVGMCSSAYEAEPDGHASSGVTHSSTEAVADANTEAAEVKEVVEAEATATESASAANAEAASTETASTETASTETASTETESNTTANAVALSATAAATTAVAATSEESAAEATESAATDATGDAAQSTAEATTETAMAETATATAEATMTEIKVEGFELSELASSGELVPDFATDLGNLKTDMGRFSGRVNEATGMFDKIREIIAR